MAAINPYLNFNGNAEDAFNFYKSVFGGEFPMVMRFKDVPQEMKMNEKEGDKIMHIALPIGDGTVLMGSDVPESYGKATVGTNFFISVSTKSKEEADAVFGGLSEGGKVSMPMSQAFWGDYFGMLTDKFGIQWMINFSNNPRP